MKVEIEWHPYPQEKPVPFGTYLVTAKERKDKRIFVSTDYFSRKGSRKYWTKFGTVCYRVKAWAELPEPFEE